MLKLDLFFPSLCAHMHLHMLNADELSAKPRKVSINLLILETSYLNSAHALRYLLM